MLFTPKTITVKDIVNELQKIKVIKNVHHIHVWQLNEDEVHFEAHIDFEEDITLSQFDVILNKVEEILYHKFEINHVNIQPEYGILELIGKNNNPINGEDKLGEIVATGFNNFACPFIRYRTMDLAVPINAKCECGRNHQLIKNIEGRKQEFFVDKTGSLITFTCSDDALWNVKDKINAYQYVQNEPGKVLLKIDAKSKFSISDIDNVKRIFLDFYPRFGIEIKFVENIPRTERGKFRYLIQNLPVEFGE